MYEWGQTNIHDFGKLGMSKGVGLSFITNLQIVLYYYLVYNELP